MKIIKVKDFKTAQRLIREKEHSNPRKIIVKYYMDGCSACEDLEPKWNNVINETSIPDDIIIAEVESESQHHLPIKSKSAFPTIAILDKNLNEKKEIVGSMEEEKLKKIIHSLLQKQRGGKRRKTRRNKKPRRKVRTLRKHKVKRSRRRFRSIKSR